ncbi:MAG: CheR family methyltransferase, partial [Deltaproteobacteria bacterium]
MDDELLQQFRRLISKKTGILVRTEDLTALDKTIAARMRLLSLSEPEDYLRLLSGDTYGSRCEWKELVIPLTIGESFFFRDKGQFAILKNRILPELIEKVMSRGEPAGRPCLKIWSAGCSSGEEPYSLAILLNGLLPGRKDWNISIVGTDINEDAIEKARLGAYTEWSFRTIEPELKMQYFKRRKDGWEIDERTRNMVTFSYGNLIDDLFPGHEICNIDLILCRNVFIYFNSDAVSAVAEKFVNTLNEGGYLMTGHGELHLHGYPGLQARIFPESVVYQKSLESGVRSSEIKPEYRIKEPEIRQKIESRSQNQEFRIETSPLLDSKKQSEIELAQEYADRGDYKKAEESCKKALEAEPYSARCYYLLSQVCEAQGKEDAGEFLKKAIYL